MSSRFEEDFLRGYRKYTGFFEGWNKKAFTTLGEITQSGLLVVKSNGHVSVAANYELIGEQCLARELWQHQSEFSFIKGLKGEKFAFGSDEYNCKNGKYTPVFRFFWFIWRIVLDSNTQLIYFFASYDPKIYEALANNFSLVKLLLRLFHKESIDIIEKCQEHLIDVASVKSDFFVDRTVYESTEREKFNALLQSVGMLRKDAVISEKEWRCLQWYCKGKSAQQTGDLLGISRRTVEGRFNTIKKKLSLQNKSELFNLLKP